MGEQPNFQEAWPGSDVTLVLEEDETVFASRLVLGLCSPVLGAMLSGEFKEAQQQVVSLPGKYIADMLELLKITHPPAQPITDKNLAVVYPLLHEYQMTSHIATANSLLENGPPNLDHLIIADKFEVPRARKRLVQWAAEAGVWSNLPRDRLTVLTSTTLLDIFQQVQAGTKNLVYDIERRLRVDFGDARCATCDSWLGENRMCYACVTARLEHVQKGVEDTLVQYAVLEKHGRARGKMAEERKSLLIPEVFRRQ